jgi:hypothetical protein
MTKLVRAWMRAGTLGLATLSGSLVARAQEAAEERSASFKAVQGAVKEDIAGGPLLVTAYALILLIVVGYGVRLVRMQQRAADDLARLERQIKR